MKLALTNYIDNYVFFFFKYIITSIITIAWLMEERKEKHRTCSSIAETALFITKYINVKKKKNDCIFAQHKTYVHSVQGSEGQTI